MPTAHPERPRAARPGFTILELLVAMTLTLVVVGAAVPFFNLQARAVADGAGRSDAMQNVQFAINAIDRDLRIAGVGAVDAQPMIVYAAPHAIAFNADLVANEAEPSAVYIDPDAEPGTVTSMTEGTAVRLPLTGPVYPDTNYWQAPGLTSWAETIAYWVERDSSSGRSDQYILWRRVNNAAPRIVSKGIVVPAGQPVFRYFKTDSLGRPVEFSQSSLPYFHSAPIHSVRTGPKPDTGKSARTDSIRAVRVRLVGLYRDARRGRDLLDTAEANIRVMNAGLNRVATCGEKPIFTSGVAVANVVLESGSQAVQIAWSASTDEPTGEKDVERYAVYRRDPSAAQFAEPLALIPAGQATYTYVDTDVQPGDHWVYGVAAQDCTPNTSPVAVSVDITIPVTTP